MRATHFGTAALLLLPACASEGGPTAPGHEPELVVASATDYRAINLGALGTGRSSVAIAVSPVGHVVGSSWTSFQVANEHAFLWRDGVMTDLGTLGGCCSRATSVNRAGKVVGVSRTASGADHGFIWKDGVMTDMGDFGTPVFEAADINAAGQITGYGPSATNAIGLIFYQERVVSRAAIRPAAINAGGWVVGESQVGFGLQRAALWRDGTVLNLGTLGGSFSSAADLNRQGVVVGISTLSNGNYRAFIWENGRMRNLGVQGEISGASGINDAGVIVGQRQLAPASSNRAFIWRNGVVQDLPSLGGKYSTASDINAAGWIVGQSRTGNDDNGGPFATLWVPK